MTVGAGERVPVLGASLRRIVAAAALAACALAQAQQPPQPRAADSPTFEIRRYLFDGATLVPLEKLEADTREFTGPRRVFGDVQKALEAVERAYADAGWSAVQVVLPEQELTRGEIRFQVIEARVARVLVEGNKAFDEANVRASVPSLAPGKAPNVNEISRNLRVVNESPAKQTQVLLRSGQEEGSVDAVLRTVDETPLKYSVTADNSGSAQTGRVRVGLGMQNANLSGYDDVLSAQYVTAPYADHLDENGQPDRFSLLPSRKVTILGVGYRLPLYEQGNSLEFLAGYSNVNSGTVANVFSITGAGTVMGAKYNINLNKVGDYEHRVAMTADWRSYDNKGVRVAGTATQVIPDVTVHPLGVTYLGTLRKQDGETSISLGFFKNFSEGNDGTTEDFCKPLLRNNGLGQCASATYNVWKWSFSHTHAMPADFQLRFAANGQWTRDMLVPGEQFGIGGADSVRGFLEREIADDKGYRVTAELYSPDFGGKTGISGARTRGLIFFDSGHVSRNHPAPAETFSQGIASYGVGMRFAQSARMALRLDFAMVGDSDATHPRSSTRLHASFSYVF
jgi:hemolysin activation/secretion protein